MAVTGVVMVDVDVEEDVEIIAGVVGDELFIFGECASGADDVVGAGGADDVVGAGGADGSLFSCVPF